ncbi:MAG: hypothetical protein ACT4OS_03930 [Acidimicrobiales bacterium]
MAQPDSFNANGALPATARHGLTQLHQLQVLQCSAPFLTKDSAPNHCVLDRFGAEVVAPGWGEELERHSNNFF